MFEQPKLYRTAFLKNLMEIPLDEEERAAFTHVTTAANNGKAVVPTELENKIYSTVLEEHPLLKDINLIRSGTVLSIIKHTEIEAGDAANVNEGAANANDEKNKFATIVLAGKDIAKHVRFSYRLGAMAIPAFEAYLVKELGSRISTQWAKNIVAQIESDLGANNFRIATPGTLVVQDIINGLAKLKGVGQTSIYMNNATFYSNIAVMADSTKELSYINNYQDKIPAMLLGNPIKIENALADGKILILDPKQYTENVVQDVLIERARKIENHTHIFAGLLIAGGTMTNEKAGALVDVDQLRFKLDVMVKVGTGNAALAALSGTKLSGAEFTLYDEAGTAVIGKLVEGTGDNKGIYSYPGYGVPLGKYKLTQTKAATGHTLPTEAAKKTIAVEVATEAALKALTLEKVTAVFQNAVEG